MGIMKETLAENIIYNVPFFIGVHSEVKEEEELFEVIRSGQEVEEERWS